MSALLHLDLLEQLSFYGRFHHKKANQIIHGIFVPAIFWSVCVWLAFAILPYDLPQLLSRWPLPDWLLSGCVANGALILSTTYGAYYIILEPFAGLTWTLFQGWPMWFTATLFAQSVPHAWAWAIGVHVFSWWAQVHIGHIMIEGSRPALTDSFFQSLVLANLFVWMEGLFAVGYRPALQAALHDRVSKNLADLHSQKEPLLKPSADPRQQQSR